MIDFRYHVVSIVAVFLALTVGLVLGASFLKPAAVDGLHTEIGSLNQDKVTLEKQQRLLQTDNARLGQYIDQTAPNLVNAQLAGESVAVVRIAGSDGPSTDAAVALLRQAGANITTDVTMTTAFTDQASAAELTELVDQYTPAGERPLSGTTLDQAVSLLRDTLAAPTGSATALLGTPHTGMTDAEANAALQALATAGMITITTPLRSTTASGPGIAFIAAPTGPDSTRQNGAYLQLTRDLHESDIGAVVGGLSTATGTGGLIAAVLADSTATKDVSTVDDVDLTIGQVAVVFAAYQAAGQGATAQNTAAGHYGMSGTNDGLLPKLPALPTPSPN
jgi:Copper transport outer membrane protein, MctB